MQVGQREKRVSGAMGLDSESRIIVCLPEFRSLLDWVSLSRPNNCVQVIKASCCWKTQPLKSPWLYTINRGS